MFTAESNLSSPVAIGENTEIYFLLLIKYKYSAKQLNN